MDRIFQQVYHVPGTLTANIVPVFKTPCDLQLLHVSASQTVADTAATIKIGNTGTNGDDDYMEAKNVGDNNVPAEYDRDDFVGTQYPHIPKGTAVLITVDFDGGQRNGGGKSNCGSHVCRRINLSPGREI